MKFYFHTNETVSIFICIHEIIVFCNHFSSFIYLNLLSLSLSRSILYQKQPTRIGICCELLIMWWLCIMEHESRKWKTGKKINHDLAWSMMYKHLMYNHTMDSPFKLYSRHCLMFICGIVCRFMYFPSIFWAIELSKTESLFANFVDFPFGIIECFIISLKLIWINHKRFAPASRNMKKRKMRMVNDKHSVNLVKLK